MATAKAQTSGAPDVAPLPEHPVTDFRPDNPLLGPGGGAGAPLTRPVRTIFATGGHEQYLDAMGETWGNLVKVRLVGTARVLGFDPAMKTATGLGGKRWGRAPDELFMPEDQYMAHPFVGQVLGEDDVYRDVASQEGHAWRVFDAQAQEIVNTAAAAIRKAAREPVNTAPAGADLAAATVKA